MPDENGKNGREPNGVNSTATVPDFKTDDLPDELKNKTELTMDDMVGIINHGQQKFGKSFIEEVRKEIDMTHKRAVFPYGAYENHETTKEAETLLGSVVDTSCFSKSYRPGSGQLLNFASGKVGGFGAEAKSLADGMSLGSQLVFGGGPFKKLSEPMQDFAKVLKCRANLNSMQMAGVDPKDLDAKVKQQMKQTGMSEGTNADGGFLVPIEFMSTVIEFAVSQSPILSRVWRMPMSSLTLRIPKLTQAAGSYFGGVNLYWIDEAETKTSTKPTFEQLTFTAHKLIGVLFFTDELIADSMINIVNYATGVLTRAFQYELERVVISGSGTGQPLGILNDGAVPTVARRTANAVDYDDLCDLDGNLDENFRDLSWIMRRKTQSEFRKLRDNNRQPIFHNTVNGFMSEGIWYPNIHGYPLYTTRNASAYGEAGDVILGDLGMYILAIRSDIKIDQSIHVNFLQDETCLRFVMRLDGKPGVSIAFTYLEGAAS